MIILKKTKDYQKHNVYIYVYFFHLEHFPERNAKGLFLISSKFSPHKPGATFLKPHIHVNKCRRHLSPRSPTNRHVTLSWWKSRNAKSHWAPQIAPGAAELDDFLVGLKGTVYLSGWALPVGNEGINLYIGILGMKLPSFPKGQLAIEKQIKIQNMRDFCIRP